MVQIQLDHLATMNSFRSKEESILALKEAIKVYENIQHSHLIQLVRHYAMDDLYIAIFKWVDGECLFDHWNFEKYEQNPTLLPPAQHFRQIPLSTRIQLSHILFSFLTTVSDKGYGAVIDERTNVYTLGALLLDSFFGNYTKAEIEKRYQEHAFTPCSIENCELNARCYEVIKKAVEKEREKRYSSIQEFYEEWKKALQTQ